MGCGVKNSLLVWKKMQVNCSHAQEVLHWGMLALFGSQSDVSSYCPTPSTFQNQYSLDCWNAMTAWQSTFTAIIWARTEGWSPSVRDWQDWARRDQEKKRHCSRGCSVGKWGGGKILRRLRFMRPLEHFKQSVCSFFKWCQSFYTNVPLIFFFLTLSRTSVDCILSREA